LKRVKFRFFDFAISSYLTSKLSTECLLPAFCLRSTPNTLSVSIFYLSRDTQENRISYNQCDYQSVFNEERAKNALKQSEEQPSLFDLVTVKIYFLILPGVIRQENVPGGNILCNILLRFFFVIRVFVIVLWVANIP